MPAAVPAVTTTYVHSKLPNARSVLVRTEFGLRKEWEGDVAFGKPKVTGETAVVIGRLGRTKVFIRVKHMKGDLWQVVVAGTN